MNAAHRAKIWQCVRAAVAAALRVALQSSEDEA